MIADIQRFENAARLSLANFGELDDQDPTTARSVWGLAMTTALLVLASLTVAWFFV